ncbi:MAG: HAD-IIB family hydrolase, partial [bacterium]
LIDKYDLYGSVAYPKQHQPEDIPVFYRIAAKTGGVFVNPALTEPFGLTLLEAGASRLPVVATRDGGPIDIIQNCENGRLIDPLNAKEMGEAIYQIIDDRILWNKLSMNGARGVKKHYSWTSHVKKYLKHARHYVRQTKPRRFWIASGKKLLQANRIVIADIDNTLIGNKKSLRHFMKILNQHSNEISFGIATGRSLESTLEILQKWIVPIPDVLITSVGSEINYGADLQADRDWDKHIHHQWEPNRIRECVDALSGMILQPEENQREHKISYFVDSENGPSRREIVRQMRKNRLHVNVIFSHQQYCDFLPERASKGLAIWYLANKWGIAMERILVAGDSGNDEGMLRTHAKAVVVGNYSSELEILRELPGVYFAEAHYAAGIIEGLHHYGFLGEQNAHEEAAA